MAKPYVLDASALLAVLNGEAGGEQVLPLLSGALMSSVNWSEVVQRAIAMGVAVGPRTRLDVQALGVRILPFEVGDAELTADVWRSAPRARLSLGDRACLALTRDRDGVAVTADRAWAQLPLDVPVKVVR